MMASFSWRFQLGGRLSLIPGCNLSLTKREESCGLYQWPELIGAKMGWDKALARMGVKQSGCRLVKRHVTSDS